jgi:hypothetical protein
MGTRRVSPSLKVATCDYAGRSYGWEPLSGQSAAVCPAVSANVRDLHVTVKPVRAGRHWTPANETRFETAGRDPGRGRTADRPISRWSADAQLRPERARVAGCSRLPRSPLLAAATGCQRFSRAHVIYRPPLFSPGLLPCPPAASSKISPGIPREDTSSQPPTAPSQRILAANATKRTPPRAPTV